MNSQKYWLISIVLLYCCMDTFGLTVPRCGKFRKGRPPKRSLLVVGGNDVNSIQQWPWMVAIRYKINKDTTKFICGGSLITKRHVLTAAHCFGRSGAKELSNFQVILGTVKQKLNQNISESIQGEEIQVMTPIDIRIHQGFRYLLNEDDIAVVALDREVETNNAAIPICLPSYQQRRLDYGHVTLVGWGGLHIDNEHSDILQEVNFRIVPLKRCQHLYRDVPSIRAGINDNIICAGDIRKQKDACRGDSGGPLILYDDEEETYYLVGIVAFGYDCGQKGFPGLYMRVTSYLKWIDKSVDEMS